MKNGVDATLNLFGIKSIYSSVLLIILYYLSSILKLIIVLVIKEKCKLMGRFCAGDCDHLILRDTLCNNYPVIMKHISNYVLLEIEFYLKLKLSKV